MLHRLQHFDISTCIKEERMNKSIFVVLFAIVGLFVVSPPTDAQADKRVIIDPGHGGKYTGTCGITGNLTRYCERDANLSVSLKLQSMLESKGFNVIMTRETDKHFSSYLSGNGGDLDMRMRYANSEMQGNNDNTIFISVHHNGHPRSPYVTGTETYYYDGVRHYDSRWPHDPLQIKYLPDSKRLAEAIHPNLVSELNTVDRGIYSDEAFYVIRNAQSPSVLLELGFMTNRQEEQRIKSNSFQTSAAQAITEGIVNYFSVYEVLDNNDNKLGVFNTLSEAREYVEKQSKMVKIFDKYRQEYIEDNARYSVYHERNGLLKEFFSLESAIDYAKKWNNSRIIDGETEFTVWSNYLEKIYEVYENNNLKESYFNYGEALPVAKKLSNAKIVRNDINEVIWTNDSGQKVDKTTSVNTISGAGRIRTSIEVSKNLYPNGFEKDKEQKTVILATDRDFADALSAGPLSAVYDNAPILLTESEKMNSYLRNELKRLGAKKAVIIGGNDAISTNVEKAVKDLGISIERLSGSHRYETNRLIIEKLGSTNGYFLASGVSYADALSTAPIAASQNWGIVLTKPNEIDGKSLNYLKGSKVRVVGGEVVINDNVEKSVKNVTSNVKRLAGETRYETLAAVLWEFEDELKSDSILLTTGLNFPDGLTAASLAVGSSSPLILTNEEMNPVLEAFLLTYGRENSVKEVKVVGGTLSDTIVHKITNRVK
jgi:N-acetylmuramoyl-L-alanine amidase